MLYKSKDLPCKRCNETMIGIESYDIRKKCEGCGGNKTEYNDLNPNPESASGRELAKAKRNGK